MGKRIAIMCSLLLALGSVSHAVVISWVSGNVGVWSDTNNWVGGILPTSADAAWINNGTATIDQDITVAQMRVAAAAGTDNATVILNSNYLVTVSGSLSSEYVLLLGAQGQGTFQQSAGTVKVIPLGNDAALELTNSASAKGVYELSGGILETKVLRKKSKDYPFTFADTGGTFVLRGWTRQFGDYDGISMSTWNQGSSLFAPGGVREISASAIGIGTSSYSMYYVPGDESVTEIDIASATSYDILNVYGSCDLTDGTLQVNFLDGYTPARNTTFDVFVVKKTANWGWGTFDTLPIYFIPEWLNLDGDPNGYNDTLRLTYVPEPAALTLLMGGLGWLLVCRKTAWIAKKA